MLLFFVLYLVVKFVESLTHAQINECLTEHNVYRSLHEQTTNLTWDASLASGSQQWANYLLQIGRMDHSSGFYGENLFAGSTTGSGIFTCSHAVDAWYNEIKYYDYTTADSTKFGKAIGHFTQVVWRSSRKVGVGIASSTSGRVKTTYIVARYTPPGNHIVKNFGESNQEARVRVYTNEVAKLKSSRENRDIPWKMRTVILFPLVVLSMT